jgi:hypothetical protein
MAKEVRNPDYIVYFVPNRKNAFWTKCGAAWGHKDQLGFNVQLDFVPVGDGRLVMRDFKDTNKNETASEPEAAPAAEATGQGA